MAIEKIKEGEGKLVDANNTIEYPEINSCIAIMVIFNDDSLYAAHGYGEPINGQKKLSDFKNEIGNKSIKHIYVKGDLGSWTENFLKNNGYDGTNHLINLNSIFCYWEAEDFSKSDVTLDDIGTIISNSKTTSVYWDNENKELIHKSIPKD